MVYLLTNYSISNSRIGPTCRESSGSIPIVEPMHRMLYIVLSCQVKPILTATQLWCRCYPVRDDPRGVCLLLLHKYRYESLASQCVPLLIHLVGAALWAADIESQNNPMVKETAPKLRQAAADSYE